MGKIMLIVRYRTKHGLRENFINDVFGLHIIDKIKCEDGFISYKYFYDAEEADSLLLVEEWESEEKQQNHLKTEHMKELKELKDKYDKKDLEKLLLHIHMMENLLRQRMLRQ